VLQVSSGSLYQARRTLLECLGMRDQNTLRKILAGPGDHRPPLPVYFYGQPPTPPEQPEEQRNHGEGENNVQNP
jgi:hypothetical protein